EHSTGSFLGSCFAYRHSSFVLTAAHCVGDLPAQELVAVWPGPIIRRCVSVSKHATADVALLTLPPISTQIDCFLQTGSYNALGEDFYAIGFTEVVTANEQQLPTARLYKGHFQRFLNYKSFLGYEYAAGEISIPAPGGLSGGPIFLPRDQQTVIAIVAENAQSAAVLDSIEEVMEDGAQYKTLYQAIIRFGVVVMLSSVSDWLEQQVIVST